jgi:cation diffusion facilitator family transporter
MNNVMQLAIGSLIVGLLVLGLKGLAWWITGSVALLSDALESTVNLTAALAVLAALRIAALPADDNHPFGHHKAEYFAAVLEGVMIVIAALLILHQAYVGLMAPRPIDAPLPGLLLVALATAINGAWAAVLIRRGRSLRSPALVADGQHLLTDVVTSVGVGAGLVLALATGWWMIDPLMALLVGVNILWWGSRIIQRSLSSLMDEAVPEETLQDIRAIIASHGNGAFEAHDLRTRRAGQATFLDFHLVVPGDMTVRDAHAICDRLEAALKQRLGGKSQVTIHLEPEHKSKDDLVIAAP